MKIYRYLYQEIAKPFIFMTAVLLVLLIATEISDTLTKVLTGQFSDNAIWVVVLYQIPILATEILPASYFLACLTTLHRLSQDSERSVFHAVGISDFTILKRLLIATALPVMLLSLALQHYITPVSNERLEAFITSQKNRPITDIVQANSFLNLNNINTTFYADKNDSASEQLKDVFTIQKNDSQFTITTASTVRTREATDNQYFIFESGEQTNFSFNTNTAIQIQEFDLMNVKIENSENSKPWQRRNAITSFNLVKSDKRADQVVVIDRFITALYIPLFCIWGVALTKFKPRSARVGAMALGIGFYILTGFSYRTLMSAAGKADISLIYTPWWFLAALAGIALWMLRSRN